MKFVPLACHFWLDLALFAPVARYFHVALAIFILTCGLCPCNFEPVALNFRSELLIFGQIAHDFGIYLSNFAAGTPHFRCDLSSFHQKIIFLAWTLRFLGK